MKTLYIVRHAKSSWGDLTTPDFERPLNERGKKDAPAMADRLRDKEGRIDIFISSPAKRAMKTCRAFCKEYNSDEDKILYKQELYHASVDTFYEVISSIEDNYSTAAIFSHNPGITDFVNSLGTNVEVDNMPTCAIFGVAVSTDNWHAFKSAEKKCVLFDYPKLTETK